MHWVVQLNKVKLNKEHTSFLMEACQCIYHLYSLGKKLYEQRLTLVAEFHIHSYDAKEKKIL